MTPAVAAQGFALPTDAEVERIRLAIRKHLTAINAREGKPSTDGLDVIDFTDIKVGNDDILCERVAYNPGPTPLPGYPVGLA